LFALIFKGSDILYYIQAKLNDINQGRGIGDYKVSNRKEYIRSYSSNHYTKKLLESNKERKRLTRQLTTLVCVIAEQIAEHCEVGVSSECELGKFKVVQVESYLGSKKFFAIEVGTSFHVITDKEPGTEFHLNNDPDAKVTVASKETFIDFANNALRIIKKFEVETDKVIDELKETIKRIVIIAE
jgi:hypothetical protein